MILLHQGNMFTNADWGLLVWSSIFFLLFYFLMYRFAMKPLKESLQKRNSDIKNALDEAANARVEIANLKAENERILTEARAERATILKEAEEMKVSIINEARNEAKQEAQKIANTASKDMENQKRSVISQVKNMSGGMALTIAEKLLKGELQSDTEQERLVDSLVDEISL